MSRLARISNTRNQRAKRSRKVISTVSQRPRLSVFVSSQHVSAQVIDDSTGKTLVSATTLGKNNQISGNLTDKAAKVGEDIATKCQKAKIKQVKFDRGSRRYHGRIKALAEAARAKGLEF